MQETVFTVLENTPLTKNVYKMELSGDTSAIKKPGQFVNLKIDGLFLRRPISVCDLKENVLTLIYKVVGKGTKAMAEMCEGTRLSVLTGLGNGYDLSLSGDKPVLIGGGVGIPPLFYLAKQLMKEGKKVTVIEGFNSEDEIFLKEEFEELGCKVLITTADGSFGIKGFSTDALPEDYTYFYACGPEPMLKSVFKSTKTSGEMSFEERMGCGFGACMGCSCKTLTGNIRICKEGPVLKKEVLLWND